MYLLLITVLCFGLHLGRRCNMGGVTSRHLPGVVGASATSQFNVYNVGDTTSLFAVDINRGYVDSTLDDDNVRLFKKSSLNPQWEKIENNAGIIIKPQERIYVRADKASSYRNTVYVDVLTGNDYARSELSLEGDITSLFFDETQTHIQYHFRGESVCYADQLLLPENTPENVEFAFAFYNCVNLRTAPILRDINPHSDCYYKMFYECSSLQSITVHFTDWGDDGAYFTEGWVEDVAENGIFRCPSALPEIRGESYIPDSWTIERF